MGLIKISLLLYFFSVAGASPARVFERAVTPDNTCGPSSVGAYTCNPSDPLGGACCSSSGICGYQEAQCGTGCQGSYGSCFSPSSPSAVLNGNLWTVAGVGSFANARTFTFTGSALPSGLVSSTATIGKSPAAGCGRTFTAANLKISGSSLKLKVPGGQMCTATSPLSCAEVQTSVRNIQYASVRTTAILSEAAGTCNGFFFYMNDTQETDIEFLSDKMSLSNPGDGSRPMFYTNQGTDGGNTLRAPSRADATSAYHEYRIDWIPGQTIYYMDGVQQKMLTTNVPAAPGPWMWNNWGNGNPYWTGPPPTIDSILTISRIVMYYNVTAV